MVPGSPVNGPFIALIAPAVGGTPAVELPIERRTHKYYFLLHKRATNALLRHRVGPLAGSCAQCQLRCPCLCTGDLWKELLFPPVIGCGWRSRVMFWRIQTGF